MFPNFDKKLNFMTSLTRPILALIGFIFGHPIEQNVCLLRMTLNGLDLCARHFVSKGFLKS